MKITQKHIKSVLKGVIIGAAGIIPGASGGIMAVAFGIYREAVDAVVGLVTDFRRSFLFLLPYGIGVAIGILLSARALEWLLEHWRMPLMYLLIGMVMGGAPAIIRSAGRRLSPKYAMCVVLGAGAVGLLSLLDGGEAGGRWPFNYATALLAGGIISVGIVIPGVSTSFVLMYMGLYEPLLSALTGMNIPMLFWAALGGAAVGGALIMFVRSMFRRYPAAANYSILGFLIGTVALIFPGFTAFPKQMLCLLLMAAGFGSTLLLDRSDPR